MERNIFLSKSFAIFTWIAISINIALNFGAVSTFYNETSKTIDQALIRLFHSPVQFHSLDNMLDGILTKAPDTSAKLVPKDDLQCMAENIYYEAGNQSYVGKLAVGQVVLNRVKTPGYPRTICQVIYEGSQSVHTTACQFSWTCAPRVAIDKSSVMWAQSKAAATDLLLKKESMLDITEGSTNYHADYVRPVWAKKLRFVGQIDQHLFYKQTAQ